MARGTVGEVDARADVQSQGDLDADGWTEVYHPRYLVWMDESATVVYSIDAYALTFKAGPTGIQRTL